MQKIFDIGRFVFSFYNFYELDEEVDFLLISYRKMTVLREDWDVFMVKSHFTSRLCRKKV